MGAFEDGLSEGYAAKAQGEEKLPGLFSDKPIRICQTCEHYRTREVGERCVSPNQPSGQEEPLFYAVLKCGVQRAWYNLSSQKKNSTAESAATITKVS